MDKSALGKGSDLGIRVMFQVFAAVVLLMMAIAAPIGLGLLQSTVQTELVRLGVFLFLVVAILDLLAAWLFFHIFYLVDPAISQLTTIFRIVYTALLVSSLGSYWPLFQANHANVDVHSLFQQFNFQWNIALLFFGIHLILLGGLIIKSRFLHFVLGILVVVSGIGYSFDSVFGILEPTLKFSISVYTFVGEALLILWLPVNAIRVHMKTKRTKSEI